MRALPELSFVFLFFSSCHIPSFQECQELHGSRHMAPEHRWGIQMLKHPWLLKNNGSFLYSKIFDKMIVMFTVSTKLYYYQSFLLDVQKLTFIDQQLERQMS